ncbi:MAG TPA: urea ABC transporter permease subunit UrtC, partial [Tepidisphaeraceae bacterium]|nr:urea ABC transporter permease subunit UrtC [Tepidisphaeraceae bacterium]
ERSRTFLSKMPHPAVVRLRRIAVCLILAIFFLAIPALNFAGIVDDYKVGLLGKYLCYAIAALGIDLVWGYTGLLSLCQALFFCIGGYAMAMHLSLMQGGGDVRPEYNNIPQFMFFNNLTALPAFWKPFESLVFAIVAGILLAGLFAAVFGFFIFRGRVRGVYFAIVTQALAWGVWLLTCRNEMLLGGTNGLTNFYKPYTEARRWIETFYLMTLATLVICYLICRAITRSRLGRVLVAIRDREPRLYFAGYQPYAFKIFSFAVGAMIAAAGGLLYPAQVGIITPQDMNVMASILMVIWVAVGGRGKLWGAIYGTLLVTVMLSSLSSDFSDLWMFFLGGGVVAVVLFFPDGFVGLWSSLEDKLARGDGWISLTMTAAPVVVLGLFVLAEALGLTPAPLQRMGWYGLRWKYIVLFVLLIFIGVYKTTDRLRSRPQPVAVAA